jgi:hypothetical protein
MEQEQQQPPKEVGLLPSRELSQTEQDLLLEIYKNPVVIKHLQILAQNDLMELAGLGTLSNTNETIVKAHATVTGKLAVLATLLSIANTTVTQSEVQPQEE